MTKTGLVGNRRTFAKSQGDIGTDETASSRIERQPEEGSFVPFEFVTHLPPLSPRPDT
jgi:hypothetical protein